MLAKHPVYEDYGQEWRLGDVLGCYLDLDSGMLQWSVNGQELGAAFHVPKPELGEIFYPAASLHDGAQLDFNFGDESSRPLQYAPHPSEWTPVGLAAPHNHCIANPLDWRLNPHDASDAIDTSPDGHSAQARNGQGWQGQRANKGVKDTCVCCCG